MKYFQIFINLLFSYPTQQNKTFLHSVLEQRKKQIMRIKSHGSIIIMTIGALFAFIIYYFILVMTFSHNCNKFVSLSPDE